MGTDGSRVRPFVRVSDHRSPVRTLPPHRGSMPIFSTVTHGPSQSKKACDQDGSRRGDRRPFQAPPEAPPTSSWTFVDLSPEPQGLSMCVSTGGCSSPLRELVGGAGRPRPPRPPSHMTTKGRRTPAIHGFHTYRMLVLLSRPLFFFDGGFFFSC